MDIRKMTAEVTGNDGAEYTVMVEYMDQPTGGPARYSAVVIGDRDMSLTGHYVHQWTLRAYGLMEALNLALGWVP